MNICIVAGGTGGHITPAIAVAEKLPKDVGIFFITGKSRKAEQRFLSEIPTSKVFFLDVKPIVGKGLGAFRGIISAFSSLKDAIEILKKIKPNIIIGFGGYVSGPSLLAGKILKSKVFIFEQNSVMGLTNKISSIFADKILLSFPDSEIPKFSKKKSIIVGFPLRNKFREHLEEGLKEKEKEKERGEEKNGGYLNILITGGSQGALSLNRLFTKTLKKIVESNTDANLPYLQIFHQTGDLFFDEAEKFYFSLKQKMKNKLAYSIFPFSEKIGYYIGLSDLVISRGGAGTVFEIAYAKKPAVFIPLPKSIGDHQLKNPLKIFGDSCVIVRQSEEGRFEVVLKEIFSGSLLSELKEKLKSFSIEDGSKKILEIILHS
ncbi:MAG: UDP-N-acetylglucosamine--N-acetylmuramyl-(pentapeptide) pyrophosphoryl-undecaprenol N-acetylglucosamine transferase [Candidatus Calescibacterium sp.]